MGLTRLQINEAFASQFAYCVDQLDIPIEKINPKCVPITPGDARLIRSLQWWLDCNFSPNRTQLSFFAVERQDADINAAGVRQVITGLEELRRRNEKVLLTSMCVGSGMGAAGVFVNERVH